MDKNIKALSREDLLKKGWSFEDINLEIKRLDQEEVPTYSYSDDIILELVCTPKMRWFFLYDVEADSIRGYWGLAPINDQFYQLMSRGENKEEDFKVEALLEFTGKRKMAISGFVLEEQYQEKLYPFKLLMISLVETVMQLISEGLIIESFVSRAFTKDGEKLCEGMGMSPLCKHPEKGIVYQLDLSQFKKVPRIAKPLYELIRKKKLERIEKDLESLSEEDGIPIVKDSLKKWGYKIDGI
jgi:hypothetical protein